MLAIQELITVEVTADLLLLSDGPGAGYEDAGGGGVAVAPIQPELLPLPEHSDTAVKHFLQKMFVSGLWIRIRMDPHSFSLLDPDPGDRTPVVSGGTNTVQRIQYSTK